MNFYFGKKLALIYSVLGIIRIYSRHTAAKLLEDLTECLGRYEISLESDISGVTTDGCNLMLSFGKEF